MTIPAAQFPPEPPRPEENNPLLPKDNSDMPAPGSTISPNAGTYDFGSEVAGTQAGQVLVNQDTSNSKETDNNPKQRYFKNVIEADLQNEAKMSELDADDYAREIASHFGAKSVTRLLEIIDKELSAENRKLLVQRSMIGDSQANLLMELRIMHDLGLDPFNDDHKEKISEFSDLRPLLESHIAKSDELGHSQLSRAIQALKGFNCDSQELNTFLRILLDSSQEGYFAEVSHIITELNRPQAEAKEFFEENLSLIKRQKIFDAINQGESSGKYYVADKRRIEKSWGKKLRRFNL